MQALTVRQPFADDIINGRKPIEYRRWPTDYRGLLLIHAARTLDCRATRGTKYRTQAIVGMVELVDCIKDTLNPNSYLWILSNPFPFQHPIHCRGNIMLWTPPEPILKRIQR